MLVRNIILTFLSPEINVNSAQFIFTIHDTWQLSNSLLRRDEIWLVEKDEDRTKVRRNEALAKKYLIGSYGANTIA